MNLIGRCQNLKWIVRNFYFKLSLGVASVASFVLICFTSLKALKICFYDINNVNYYKTIW